MEIKAYGTQDKGVKNSEAKLTSGSTVETVECPGYEKENTK